MNGQVFFLVASVALVVEDNGALAVSGALQRLNGQGLVRGATKTDGSARVLPLSPALIDALRTHIARQHQECGAAGADWQASDFVFTTASGTPIDPRSLVRHFKAPLEAAGLPDVPFHGLRHTAATLLVSAGRPSARRGRAAGTQPD